MSSLEIQLTKAKLDRLEKKYQQVNLVNIELSSLRSNAYLMIRNESFSGDVEGMCKPKVPWQGPKEFEIDPKEFSNFELIVTGSAAQGKIHVSQSSEEESDFSSLINVTVQILLGHESLQNRVSVISSFNSSSCHLKVTTPGNVSFPSCILVNVNITFPKNLKIFGNFYINVINNHIIDDNLKNITFNYVGWKSSQSIKVKSLKSREIAVQSLGNISGNYYIDRALLLKTDNAWIDATVKSLSNSTPRSIHLFTSNSAIQGSYPFAHLFEVRTSNGKIDLEVNGKSQSGGKIILTTSNGNIGGRYDVSSGWHASTSNGNINVELSLANSTADKLVRISGKTSNGRIKTFVSDLYNGRFRLQTSNGKTNIEGNDHAIDYKVNTTSYKIGYIGNKKNNELLLSSSNGKIDLKFLDN
ncbi:5150_t:CDS:2 [Funneliformis mosseae]|uniref:5150_t:CDS:1 n=1 Tax=Funneliformis mosseae TaxID=27381 RepID=A0A9N9CFW5_FUNMO|nr:5150_t:CDS:2 [Funneliformis mosseae]